jgi:hypothetical protein
MGCKSLYIYSNKSKLTEFLAHAAQSLLYFSQNTIYFIVSYFFVNIILMLYMEHALKFKCPTPLVRGWTVPPTS